MWQQSSASLCLSCASHCSSSSKDAFPIPHRHPRIHPSPRLHQYSPSAGPFGLSLPSPGTARQTRVTGARARLASRNLSPSTFDSVATSVWQGAPITVFPDPSPLVPFRLASQVHVPHTSSAFGCLSSLLRRPGCSHRLRSAVAASLQPCRTIRSPAFGVSTSPSRTAVRCHILWQTAHQSSFVRNIPSLETRPAQRRAFLGAKPPSRPPASLFSYLNVTCTKLSICFVVTLRLKNFPIISTCDSKC